MKIKKVNEMAENKDTWNLKQEKKQLSGLLIMPMILDDTL